MRSSHCRAPAPAAGRSTAADAAASRRAARQPRRGQTIPARRGAGKPLPDAGSGEDACLGARKPLNALPTPAEPLAVKPELKTTPVEPKLAPRQELKTTPVEPSSRHDRSSKPRRRADAAPRLSSRRRSSRNRAAAGVQNRAGQTQACAATRAVTGRAVEPEADAATANPCRRRSSAHAPPAPAPACAAACAARRCARRRRRRAPPPPQRAPPHAAAAACRAGQASRRLRRAAPAALPEVEGETTGGRASALSYFCQQGDQARRIPAAAAHLLDSANRTGRPAPSPADGRRCGALRRGRSPGPCASSRPRSRNRTCRRSSSCSDSPSARIAPRLWKSPRRRAAASRPALAAKCNPSARPCTRPAMQIWLTILVNCPAPGPPISRQARA